MATNIREDQANDAGVAHWHAQERFSSKLFKFHFKICEY